MSGFLSRKTKKLILCIRLHVNVNARRPDAISAAEKEPGQERYTKPAAAASATIACAAILAALSVDFRMRLSALTVVPESRQGRVLQQSLRPPGPQTIQPSLRKETWRADRHEVSGRAGGNDAWPRVQKSKIWQRRHGSAAKSMGTARAL